MGLGAWGVLREAAPEVPFSARREGWSAEERSTRTRAGSTRGSPLSGGNAHLPEMAQRSLPAPRPATHPVKKKWGGGGAEGKENAAGVNNSKKKKTKGQQQKNEREREEKVRTCRWSMRRDATRLRREGPDGRPRLPRRFARSAGYRAPDAGHEPATRRGRRGSWIPRGGSIRACPWHNSCKELCRCRRRTWSCPCGSGHRRRRHGGPWIAPPTTWRMRCRGCCGEETRNVDGGGGGKRWWMVVDDG